MRSPAVPESELDCRVSTGVAGTTCAVDEIAVVDPAAFVAVTARRR